MDALFLGYNKIESTNRKRKRSTALDDENLSSELTMPSKKSHNRGKKSAQKTDIANKLQENEDITSKQKIEEDRQVLKCIIIFLTMKLLTSCKIVLFFFFFQVF